MVTGSTQEPRSRVDRAAMDTIIPTTRRRRRDTDSDSSSVTSRSSSSGFSFVGPRYQEDPLDIVVRRKTRRSTRKKTRNHQRYRRRPSWSTDSRSVSRSRSRSRSIGGDSLVSAISDIERLETRMASALRTLRGQMNDLRTRVHKLEPFDSESETGSVGSVKEKATDDKAGTDGDAEGEGGEEVLRPAGEGEANFNGKGTVAEEVSTESPLPEKEKIATRKFELTAKFFDRSDKEQQLLYNSSAIYPFMRVRWGDHHSKGADAVLEDSPNKGKTKPGSDDIIEICFESPVFANFVHSVAEKLTHPVSQVRSPDSYNTISFYKPFRWLLQHRDIFQSKLNSLQQEFEGENTTSNTEPTDSPESPSMVEACPEMPAKDAAKNGDEVGDKDSVKEGATEDSAGSKLNDDNLEQDLRLQLKFFLDFMDEHIGETIKLYEEARAGNLKTIAFENLWMLYKPGDVIYTPFRRELPTGRTPPARIPAAPPGPPPVRVAGPGPPPIPFPGDIPGVREGIGRDTPQAYQIISVLGGRTFSVPLGPQSKKSNSYTQLKVLCFYIDFNGLRYDCVADTFTFRPFENEMEITSLDAYPISYATADGHTGEAEMLKFLKKRGQQFVEVSEVSHKLYEGLAFNATREEINTPVVIDFALAYQNTPRLQPMFNLPTVEFFNQTMKNQRAELYEAVVDTMKGRRDDWFWQHQTLLTSKARIEILDILNEYPSVTPTDKSCIPTLKKEMEANGHILLLPGLVHGFALRNRKWVSLELSLVQDAQYEDGWKDLILPTGHKEMVRAVVENHATGSRSTAGAKGTTTEVDIVRGKGKGCIILLHGEPGVGKTSTAECVAAFTKRPLFPITCGDIGYEPDDVERNLDKHFNLAHKWGCVMLLDEADVFLAKRSRDDLKRNGLVSVFLRILEYYPGILFLTTNRVGAFDDAFRSRLHLTLYYPKLDRKQTIQIWEMNLRRVNELNAKRVTTGLPAIEIQHDKIIHFIKKHWSKLSWNGRQIRNAFQTAIALAEFDVRDDAEKQVVMSKKQFKTIAKASMQFDDYLFHTHGHSDEATNAKKEQVRWDFDVKRRPGKGVLSDSDSSASADSCSSSSSSDSSSDESDEESESSDDAKRSKKKKKGKDKEKDKKKKSSEKGKKSKPKKDKH